MIRKIVVTKGKLIAVYGNLSQACDQEGWADDYNKLRARGYPFEHEGRKVHRVPNGVSISCFELLDMVCSKKTAITQTKLPSKYLVSLEQYNKEYMLEIEYSTKHEEANMERTDRGLEEETPARSYDIAKSITLAEEVTEHGPKQIKLDKWTEEQIINQITLQE